MFSVLTLCISKGFSQADYQQGFIVNLNGDTLYGMIDFRSDTRNSRIVKFKDSEYADQITFYPYKISSYHVNDESFYSKKVNEKDKERNVFMQLMVGGKISFYRYRDQGNEVHFYIEKGDDFVELTNDLKEVAEKDPVTGTNKTYISNSNKYYGVLKYLFSDCEYYQKNEPKVDFNAGAIAKEVSRYNACFDTKTTDDTKIKRKKGVFKKSILIGINIADIVESGNNNLYWGMHMSHTLN